MNIRQRRYFRVVRRNGTGILDNDHVVILEDETDIFGCRAQVCHQMVCARAAVNHVRAAAGGSDDERVIAVTAIQSGAPAEARHIQRVAGRSSGQDHGVNGRFGHQGNRVHIQRQADGAEVRGDVQQAVRHSEVGVGGHDNGIGARVERIVPAVNRARASEASENKSVGAGAAGQVDHFDAVKGLDLAGAARQPRVTEGEIRITLLTDRVHARTAG